MSGIRQSPTPRDDERAIAVVVVTASAGGLEPLRSFARGLSSPVPAAVVIAQHVGERSLLAEILSRDTSIPVTEVQPGAPLRSGVIYVCPAQQHVAVNPDATAALSRRERLAFVRPSGDWLFRSAAASFGERAIGVVLSGLRNDGAQGALAIRDAGGTVIAQSPDSCVYSDMPRAAIGTGAVDFILRPDQIATTVMRRLAAIDVDQCRTEWDAPFLRAG